MELRIIKLTKKNQVLSSAKPTVGKWYLLPTDREREGTIKNTGDTGNSLMALEREQRRKI